MKRRCKHRDEFYRRLGHIFLKELQRADLSRGVSLQKRIKPQAGSQEQVF